MIKDSQFLAKKMSESLGDSRINPRTKYFIKNTGGTLTGLVCGLLFTSLAIVYFGDIQKPIVPPRKRKI